MQSILITGGTGDLGQVVVPRLLRDYRCVVSYRSEEGFRKLGEHPNLVGVKGDDDPGPLYGMVLLAGGFALGGSAGDFQKMIDINLMTAVRTIEANFPGLADGGRIVAISSLAALQKPAGLAAYVVSKAALAAYIEVLSKELRPRRITASVLLPDAMDTPQNAKSMKQALVPRARVAETIAFLLSEGAGNVTGQLVTLNAV
jgi:NAD(P)-dependent dehydrogenase (short-subunit alcohol dehydrogenase family)